MSIMYRFRKEKLASGSYISRPVIPITVKNGEKTIQVSALIDSGCDITVIPEDIARVAGLDLTGKKSRLFAYRESSTVIESKANITFTDKNKRESKTIKNMPVLISCHKPGSDDGEEIVIGIQGVFDIFNVHFKKTSNKIIFKQAQ